MDDQTGWQAKPTNYVSLCKTFDLDEVARAFFAKPANVTGQRHDTTLSPILLRE